MQRLKKIPIIKPESYEPIIGEKFKHNGNILQCIEEGILYQGGCDNCYFINTVNMCGLYSIDFKCARSNRLDGKDIYLRLISSLNLNFRDMEIYFKRAGYSYGLEDIDFIIQSYFDRKTGRYISHSARDICRNFSVLLRSEFKCMWE